MYLLYTNITFSVLKFERFGNLNIIWKYDIQNSNHIFLINANIFECLKYKGFYKTLLNTIIGKTAYELKYVFSFLYLKPDPNKLKHQTDRKFIDSVKFRKLNV